MRIQLLSDLHFEFYRDEGYSFVAGLDPKNIDLLVIAGDVTVADHLVSALSRLSQRYFDSKVVYVHGNHEFYGSNRRSVLGAMERAMSMNSNLVWLDNSSVTLGGITFRGSPLWFPPFTGDPRIKSLLSDFSVIEDFESWVYEENSKAVAFFERELQEGDVVITHHLPSQISVASQFVANPLNPFFVCDMTRMITERKPRYWLHGHTHTSVKAQLGDTTIICNPFGYAGREQN